MRKYCVMLWGLLALAGPLSARQAHPHILVAAKDKALVWEKIRSKPWAAEVFRHLQEEADPFVQRHRKDPQWILSRYLMNRVPGKRYTQFYADAQGTALVRYGGDAPYPTVRVSPHKRPPITDDGYTYRMPSLEELIPYDTSMTMRLQSNAPGQPWKRVDPQNFVGRINGEINSLALDAAILYWLTGREEYAVFAADILSQWARGAYYQEPIIGPCRTGFLDIQTLGDAQAVPLILAYDFLYDFLRQHGYDTRWYEPVFDKIAATMTFRGYWNNNWFAAQSPAMVYAALSLQDRQKRDFYLSFYLRRDTVQGACGHLALPSVVHRWLTPDGHWKEPGGYHNYPVGNLLVSAMALEKNGYPVFEHFPALFRAATVMLKYAFPNKKNPAFGDNGGRPAQSPEALEIALAMASRAGQAAPLQELTAAMQALSSAGGYDRSRSGYLGLLCFLPDWPAARAVPYRWPRSGALDYARCYLQRNGTDSLHGLMYVVQGATYNHNHANGMAMELYGAGLVMGADPGKGLTYEAPLHVQYYAQWAAHNTVVAAGRSSAVPAFRGGGGAKHIGEISLAAMEPLPGQEAVSAHGSFTDTRYRDPVTGARQQRVMAIVRTGDTAGYYVDIYRSSDPQDNAYLYHNIGQGIQWLDAKRRPLATQVAEYPLAPGDPPGLGALHAFRGTGLKGEAVTALFSVEKGPRPSFMQVLFPAGTQRKYYEALAPVTRTAPAPYRSLPTPVIICRQEGEAWNRPFVAVYEPFLDTDGYRVEAVEKTAGADGFLALQVRQHGGSSQRIFQALDSLTLHEGRGWSFEGSFALVGLHNDSATYLYLGRGKTLACGPLAIRLQGGTGAAALEREGDHWRISCQRPAMITLPTVSALWLDTGKGRKPLSLQQGKGKVTFAVPALQAACLYTRP